MPADPFVGTWKLNVERSEFDANHRPSAATMVFELDSRGNYLMKAEGAKANGEKVAERPVQFIPDGKEHQLPDFPGLKTVYTRPHPNTITGAVTREDGSVAGGGTYEVSLDGSSLTATTFGYDSQLRQFKQQTVWDRQ
jgi:hypothetical protein